jgi:hypothetical protein
MSGGEAERGKGGRGERNLIYVSQQIQTLTQNGS